MANQNGPFRTASTLTFVSAVLYLIAAAFVGWTGTALILALFGGILALVAMGLARGWRWLGHSAFLLSAGAGIVAMANIWSDGGVPGWLYAAIALSHGLGALILFAALWRAAPAAISTDH